MTRRKGLERMKKICEFGVSWDELFEDVLSLNSFFFKRTFFALRICTVYRTQSKHIYLRHSLLYPYYTATGIVNITTIAYGISTKRYPILPSYIYRSSSIAATSLLGITILYIPLPTVSARRSGLSHFQFPCHAKQPAERTEMPQ